MIELFGMGQGELESFREFVKRYRQVILNLGVFNHPQVLRELKEDVKMGDHNITCEVHKFSHILMYMSM